MQQGLQQNWRQFTLLLIINAFVGGMVGLERSILPSMATEIFGLEAHSAILSFIIVFGITKAISNYLMGKMAKRKGPKKLLIIGWLFGLPVPFMLMYAPDWNWIIGANVLLGVNQGFAWSATVIMKIDLVGEKNRGLAMGINEFAGYLAVGVMAFATAWIASSYGIRPYPFYAGVVLAISGLVFSIFLLKDTQHHLASESSSSQVPMLNRLFFQTSILHRNLGSVTQAGLVNNLNDGMVWGLLPIFLAAKNYNLEQIGIIVAVYPAVWGIGQLFTGKLADHFCKRNLLFLGMLLQALALGGFVISTDFWMEIGASALLGWGTAMVYPTFLASIAENIHPDQRAESIGIFRLWRDLGYAIGALLTGLIADAFGLDGAIWTVAALTFFSALVIRIRMSCSILKVTKPSCKTPLFKAPRTAFSFLETVSFPKPGQWLLKQ